jgi:hypothetical protein
MCVCVLTFALIVRFGNHYFRVARHSGTIAKEWPISLCRLLVQVTADLREEQLEFGIDSEAATYTRWMRTLQ